MSIIAFGRRSLCCERHDGRPSIQNHMRHNLHGITVSPSNLAYEATMHTTHICICDSTAFVLILPLTFVVSLLYVICCCLLSCCSMPFPPAHALHVDMVACCNLHAIKLLSMSEYDVNTTFACRHQVQHNHAMVAAMQATGAVLLGKTNLHELGVSPLGLNMHFGVPRNPHNSNCFCGGSSSGSAAVVAAGLCPFAIGVSWLPDSTPPLACSACSASLSVLSSSGPIQLHDKPRAAYMVWRLLS